MASSFVAYLVVFVLKLLLSLVLERTRVSKHVEYL